MRKYFLLFTAIAVSLSCKGMMLDMHPSDGMPFDSTQLVKTGEMLDEDIYWDIVDRSLIYKDDQGKQIAFLTAEIEKLSPKQIVGFSLRTEKLLYDTYTSDMWCAGYIMNGGCSDDGFQYFRNWVISRGRSVYYKAKKHPDDLIEEVGEVIVYEFEEFWYVAHVAFANKTGKNLEDYIDYTVFTSRENAYPDFEFTWNGDDKESMRRICPKLMEKFWN